MKTTNIILGVDFFLTNPVFIEIKEYFSKLGNRYTYTPHVGLLLSPITLEKSKEAFKDIEEYIKKLNQIEYRFSTIRFEPNTKAFLFDIDSKELVKCHNDITKIANNYRDGEIRPKDLERLNIKPDYFTPSQKNMLLTNGFAYSGVEFKAHTTLGSVGIMDFNKDEILNYLNEKLNKYEYKTLKCMELTLKVFEVFKTDAKEIEKIYMVKDIPLNN